MKELHLIIQPKGGAGKSFVALHLIQYLREQGKTVTAFDLDTANNTLSQFEALNSVTVDITRDSDPRHVDHSKFDLLLEKIVETDSEHVVVDIGASIIQDFLNHVGDLDFFNMTADLGIQTVIHTPISGGQGLIDNLGGLKIVYDFVKGPVSYVVWANPYFGEVSANELMIEDMRVVKSISELKGIVYIPEWKHSTPHFNDVKNMVTNKLTYAEVAESEEFGIFNKTRLKKIKEDFFAKIDIVGLVPPSKKSAKKSSNTKTATAK